MKSLLDALGIQTGDCVAVVGAGGKTTLCWRIVQELAIHNHRAVFTTTTKIWQPAPGVFDVMRTGQMSDIFKMSDISNGWRTACVAHSVEGTSSTTPVNGSVMPVVQTKLNGFNAQEICALHTQLKTKNLKLTTLVEADGARGLRIKAPGEGEPVIPSCADAVCVLANLDAIGRPLDDRIAHRVDRVAQLTQTLPGTIITASLIIALLSHPEGGLKGIPPIARKIAVLTQHADNASHSDARRIVLELCKRGFDHAVTISARAAPN